MLWHPGATVNQRLQSCLSSSVGLQYRQATGQRGLVGYDMADDAGRQERLRLRADLLDWRAVDGEVVALDLQRSTYLGSNHAGGLLWQALAEGTTRAALTDLLVTTYSLPVDSASSDVDAFLDELAALGLLEP